MIKPFLIDEIGQSGTIVGLMGSMYFAGWAIACLLFSRLPDIYGRKRFFMISMAI
jgi:MFS family permease